MGPLERRCANCDIFGWKQADPTISPLKRCTGCYKISYCSKECQEQGLTGSRYPTRPELFFKYPTRPDPKIENDWVEGN